MNNINIECYDYFLVSYTNGRVDSRTYLFTECEFTGDGGDGGGGGGGGGGNDGPNPPRCPQSVAKVVINGNAPPSTDDPIGEDDDGFPPPDSPTGSACMVQVPPDDAPDFTLTFCDGMSSEQRNIIQTTVNTFKTQDCASKFLANRFKTGSFKFCIGATPVGVNAFYNPSDNSFTFGSDYVATRTDLLMHEFFHAFQNSMIPGGTSPYGRDASTGVNSAGFVNIEFEQAVFNDIYSGDRSAFVDGTQQQKNDYSAWISTLTAGGTTYPKFNTSYAQSQFLNTYNSFLAEFNSIPTNTYHSAINNLTPTSLINIFNNTNPDCQ